jgi:predicted DNA-binding antitoxin AbrB/MazE fold protein
MSIEFEATYENGCLKPDRPLPLGEQQRVRVVVDTEATVARRSYGVIGWKGDVETVRQAAMEPSSGVLESP